MSISRTVSATVSRVLPRPIGPDPGAGVPGTHKAHHGVVGPRIAVLRHQMLVQIPHVDRPRGFVMLFHPRRDRLRPERLLTTPVDRSESRASQVIPYRPLAHPQQAGHLAVVLPLLAQDLTRHDPLPAQVLRHRRPPAHVLDARDPLNLIFPAYFELMTRFPSVQSEGVVAEFIH